MSKETYHTIAGESFEAKKNLYVFDLCYENTLNMCAPESFISGLLNSQEKSLFTSHIYRYRFCQKEETDYVTHKKTVGEFQQEISAWEGRNKQHIERAKERYIADSFPKLFSYESFMHLLRMDTCYYCGISEKEFSVLKKYSYPFKSFYTDKQSLSISRKNKYGQHTPDNTIISCLWCEKTKEDNVTAEDFQLIGNAFQQLWKSKLPVIQEYIGSRTLSEQQEEDIKRAFSSDMNPREWVARNGHRIVCGDMRRYSFQDKTFERWIHEVFDSLILEDKAKL